MKTSTLGVSGVSAESSLGEAVSTRSNIFVMTQLAELLCCVRWNMECFLMRFGPGLQNCHQCWETRLAEYYAASVGDKFNLSDHND